MRSHHRRGVHAILLAGGCSVLLSGSARSQIRVNPTGVNVNAQGATTVFLTFGGLGTTYVPVEAFWCGELVPAAPDIGSKCDPQTLFGRLPIRYDQSRLIAGVFTDIMSIPPSVARRAYQAAEAGDNSSFFYVRRFASTTGLPDQYVAVTCRMAGGGARVPLALTDVKLSFDVETPVLFLQGGTTPPPLTAEIIYTGTGRLTGRWEIVRPGEQPPDEHDLLTEATLPLTERGTQRHFTELERFNVFLPPTGKITLRGPDPRKLPTTIDGKYLVLLRVEASDDKEGDSNLAAVGAGTDVVHSGGVAGFPLPVLQYVVGAGGSELSPSRVPNVRLALLLPGPDAVFTTGQSVEFTWNEMAGTSLYQLEVETRSGQPLLGAVIAGGLPLYRPPPWLAQRAGAVPLRWRVVALDARGSPTQRTPWRWLRFEQR